MKKAGVNTDERSAFLMASKDFTTLGNSEEMRTVRLSVRDLGFESDATTDQIYARAKELGLELCPAETGPAYRLATPNQAMHETTLVAMKQITGQGGNPGVFSVYRNPSGRWLDAFDASPGSGWDAGYRFLFRLRKLETQKA
jgi:hypothetical protein